MLKTNSKQAIKNICDYIERLITPDNYGYSIEDFPTFGDKAKFIIDTFRSEYYTNGNYQESFVSWLSGLPSVFDSADYYYCNSAVEILGDILEETEAERERYGEVEAETMLSRLIYRELYKAYNKHVSGNIL